MAGVINPELASYVEEDLYHRSPAYHLQIILADWWLTNLKTALRDAGAGDDVHDEVVRRIVRALADSTAAHDQEAHMGALFRHFAGKAMSLGDPGENDAAMRELRRLFPDLPVPDLPAEGGREMGFPVEVRAVYRGPLDDARVGQIRDVFHDRGDVRDQSVDATLAAGEVEFWMVVEAGSQEAASATAAQVVGEVLAATGGDVSAWEVGEPRAEDAR